MFTIKAAQLKCANNTVTNSSSGQEVIHGPMPNAPKQCEAKDKKQSKQKKEHQKNIPEPCGESFATTL